MNTWMIALTLLLSCANASAAPHARDSENLVTYAMKDAYGNYDAAKGSSSVSNSSKLFPKFLEANTPQYGSLDGPVICRPAQWIEVSANREILLTRCLNHDADCHACKPTFGILEFATHDDVWQSSGIIPFVQRVGTWGKLPEAKLRKLGPDLLALEFDDGDDGQGFTAHKLLLISLETKPRELLSEITGEDNSGSCGKSHNIAACYRWSTSVTYEGEKSPAGKITLIRKGTKSKSYRSVVKVDSKPRSFCYANGKYSLCKSE